MVRRQDPAWGFVGRAKRANADTFHFTNCAPQQWQFNETKPWAVLEDYVLLNAVEGDEKVSVFTGPVFGDDDPTYRYVRVPTRFWKIVARVNENKKLVATGFLADQGPKLGQIPERLDEAFSNVSKVKIYQIRISEIQNLTKLNFGPLAGADSFPGGEALEGPESERNRRLLQTVEDILL
jgi:endonuclease G